MTTEESKIKIFDNIALGGQSLGVFKVHPGGIGWKGKETGKVVTCQTSDIKLLHYLRMASSNQLRLILKNNTVFKLDGFKEADIEQLREFTKSQYGLDIEEIQMAVKGWNWGEGELQGSTLAFRVDGKTAFELPLAEITNCGLSGKSEVSVEFRTEDSKEIRDDSLVEVRFFIPNKRSETEEKTSAEFFEEAIKNKADLGVVGESIIAFDELPCLTPRGRYNVEMFPTFMRLHGKTYDYKIHYENITRLFLLPKPDEQHILFVVGMDPAIRQGQTRYPFLVLQFLRDDEIEISLNISTETIQEKYAGQLKKDYAAPTFEVVSGVFKALTGKNITVPGHFRSKTNAHAIKCAMKANDGYLYPLEKSFFFIPKPTLFIRYADVSGVEFARYAMDAGSASSSRLFDLKVFTKGGIEYQFSNVAREEYQNLYNFIVEKKLPIRNIVSEEAYNGALDDYSDLDDENEEGGDEDGFKLKAVSDEESEEDEDYRPPSDNEDVAEEFDEEHESESSEGDEGEDKEKLKNKEKKATKRKTTDGGPKRPSSAFMFFSQHIRPKIVQENPSASFGDIGKIIGEKWKGLSSEDKKPFIEKEQDDKARYQREIAENSISGSPKKRAK